MVPMQKRKTRDDDFILTLSDDDGASFGVNDYIDEAVDHTNLIDFSLQIASKKRRFEAEVVSSVTKKQKKQGERPQGKSPQHGVNMGSSQGDSIGLSDDDDPGKDDGALDPKFEFDIGDVANHGQIEEFDGWEASETSHKINSNKKAVDIDDIISRRRVQKEEEERRKRRKTEKRMEQNLHISGDSEMEDNDDESELEDNGINDDGFENFDDDELLAGDGFGMGADIEDEQGQVGSSTGAFDEDESDENEIEDISETRDSDHGDDQSDSENSTASPVLHPDDLTSDIGGDNSGDDEEEKAKQKAFFAAEERPSNHSTERSTTSSFQNFNLSRPILRGLAAVGFTNPTPIQRKTVPVALLGKDIVAGAVTGSGKTGAFLIPILERLLYRPRKVPTSRVAIIAPTRELSYQIYRVAEKLASYTDIKSALLVGGFSLREQENVLKKRPDIIIATPGRFIDHMRNSPSFTVDTLEVLVLDEADRMLEDGFADELNEILTTIPKSRQTMLFSATMTSSVDKLIRVGLNRPIRLMVDSKKQTVGTLVQEFVRLRPGREDKRLGYLIYLCKEVYTRRVIIFFRQKKEAHRARIVFGLFELKAVELHGSMSQEQRIKSIEGFRDGHAAFLLATDVASRGLDIKGVETVINYEAPQTHEIYLHRVGRTARAGRSGRACTLAAEPDRKIVKAVVKTGKAQGAKIVSRIIDPTIADALAEEVESLADEIGAILREEKEEKQLAQVEMQLTKGVNIIKHEAEIKSRPKRTWFESEKEKQAARQRGLLELNGADSSKKVKGKLSGKEKKRLDDARQRKDGRVWKKGKNERENNKNSNNGKLKPKKNKGKGKGNTWKKSRE